MSLNVVYQTIDVGLIQGRIFDCVRGKGTLEALRPQVRRKFEVIREFAPWKRLVCEAYRDGSDKLPDWFDGAAFERRRYFIVESAPDRVAELSDLYHNVPDEAAVRRLVRSQLAILDPESVRDPGRWTPKPVEWDWDVEEQVEYRMAPLARYAAPPGGEPKRPLDHRFTSALLQFNEGLQLTAYSDNYYCLKGLANWVGAEYRECLEWPDDVFRPLFAAHPELEEDLAKSPGRYPWCPAAGMYVRPANVSRARRAAEAALHRAQGWLDADLPAREVLQDVADLLWSAERSGLGVIERCA
jgi:hypothetical protein